MENTNLENLNRLAKLFGTDRLISPEEIQQIFKGIVEILATYKKDTSSINEDTKSVVNKLLEDVISIHKESVDAVEEKKKELGNDFADKLTELRQMVTSIQEEMDKEDEVPEDDTDDEEEKQALIAEIMAQITLPEVKAAIVSGEEIVDKINELPLDEDNKIDWARIKNAPKIGKQTISGSPTVLANAVDLDGSTRANNYAIVWDATRGRYTHTAMSGGGSPGGSTTQLQYNNAGAFGGISGATTDGTAVTYTANNLKAADITASGSGGFLIQSNSGTDVGLFGAGGGAGATFYGGVNLNTMTTGSVLFAGASGAISQDNSNLFWDDTNNRLGIGTASPGKSLHVAGQGGANGMLVGDASIGVGYVGMSFSGTLTSTNYNLAGGSDSNLYVNRPTGGNILFRENNGTARVVFNASGLNGFETTAPTHTLTLASTSTGIALYNTADQTTNYERGRLFWSGNEFNIAGGEAGGTGVGRALKLTGGVSTISINSNATNKFLFTVGTSGAAGPLTLITGTVSASSGTQTWLGLTPTINQSTSAGYTALLVNPTETTTGSGSKRLLDLQVNSTSLLSVDNLGDIDWQTGAHYIRHGGAQYIGFNAGTGKMELVNGLSTGNGTVVYIAPTATSTSASQKIINISPTINQTSGTGGYTALHLNVTETATGSGTKLLADFQVGGTSRFSISNGGETNIGRQVTGNYIPLTLTNTSTAIGDNVVISMRPANLSTGRAQIHAVAPGGSDAELAFYTSNNNASPTEKVRIDDIGNVGIGQTAPTAYLHIKAGAAAAESAPLKLTSGTNLTTPENGAIEYDGTNFYATPSGAVRQTVDLFYNNALTATSNAATVPVAYKMTTVTNNSAATLTITITTSGAVDGQLLMVRIKDFSAVAQTITWVNTENSTVTAPVTSNGSTTLPLTVGFQYNSATSLWRCIASA